MEDITKALAYEIKQDIANRYFGFRKRIETESAEYVDQLHDAGKEIVVAIKSDMQRMRYLLQKDELFQAFLNFTGLPEALGLHSNAQTPAQSKLLFAGFKGEGFTKKRRYRNLVFKVYRSLVDNVAAYRGLYSRLQEEHEDICAEIDQFYRKNDLSGILNFLREIDNPDGLHSGIFQSDRCYLAMRDIDEKLRIIPPPPVTSSMHSLKQLSPLEAAKPTLKGLIDEAFPLLEQHHLEKLPL